MSWRSHPHAPKSGERLCRVEAIPNGNGLEVLRGEGGGALRILLTHSDGGVRAYVNECPHFSLPLNSTPGEFLLTNDGHIMCAYHCALFRLHDGFCVEGPAKDRSLQAIPVTVVDGEVRVAANG
ncbi:nitrite reductase/ring-hydroxylating ferredoxin subunit [Povalibacter uvarum]|uniref:Nitrite reductase/ring-hydroxylating ferredoxin subunit n=1 Tax=Povalibacter uvarum TaxID=732238 RepID=A0A841HW53_9GAMM|nr:Rieske 2Fe-2S domain-containing protein [Povalibacter uvarum]MBB6096479.1 nitrite reductase/ring-hydroxylating ferredoxin subunit [Povalibacter uvarum]